MNKTLNILKAEIKSRQKLVEVLLEEKKCEEAKECIALFIKTIKQAINTLSVSISHPNVLINSLRNLPDMLRFLSEYCEEGRWEEIIGAKKYVGILINAILVNIDSEIERNTLKPLR